LFRGISQLNVDAKGRVALPAKYRERLQETSEGKLVLTIDPTNAGNEPCLLLYPLPAWDDIQSKIDALSSFNPSSRKVQRLLVGHADDVVMDGNGRILLSAALREYARIEKRVALIGQGKKFELWDEATWNASRENWLEEAVSGSDSLPAELDSLSL
jgi:MraZ protein